MFQPPKTSHYLMVAGGFKVGAEKVFERRCVEGFCERLTHIDMMGLMLRVLAVRLGFHWDLL